MIIDIEFDDAKDAVNICKHGVSLALGAALLEGVIGQVEDSRKDYGEVRLNAFGLVNGRLYTCTYTRRDSTLRMISVRKANSRERRHWLS